MLFKRQKLPGVLLHRPADANEITQTPPFCSTPLARWGAACTSRGAIIVRVFIVRPPAPGNITDTEYYLNTAILERHVVNHTIQPSFKKVMNN
eukprot:scaffold62463_cov21-Tisochrysis_lutea.AAC.2